MKIKKVIITGMHKVGRKVYEINDGVTYFVGPNGVGKSTVLEAIQLGLLGYIPGYGKTNESIIKHASGPSLSISLVLDNDISIDRTWTRSGSSVRSTTDIKNSESKDLNELISDIELPIFNFNEFRSMTSNKLKEWFISFLPSTADSIDIEGALARAAEERSLPYDDLLSDLLNRVSTKGLSGLELIKQINTTIKEDQSFVKGQITRLQSTIESLVHYDDAPVRDESEISEEINKLNSIKVALVKYESAKSIYDKASCSVKELKESLPGTCYSDDARIVEMESKLKQINDEMASIESESTTLRKEERDLQLNRMNLIEKRSSISSALMSKCPYTNQDCESLSKIAEMSTAKLDSINNEISEIDNKLANIGEKMKKCDLSVYRSKEAEKRQIASNIEFIRSQYVKLAALNDQLVDPGNRPSDKSLEEIESELTKLNNDLAMVKANNRFDELTDQVTKDKFKKENELEVLKIWDKVTGANGLQSTMMETPFLELASEMSNYLTSMFGTKTEAKFNLSSKANSFSFGLIRDESYIEFDYLSSGERCLFTLAMIMCILNKSKSEIRTILIDDILDHLDNNNSDYLFDTLTKIDNIQFILAGVKECKYPDICKPV